MSDPLHPKVFGHGALTEKDLNYGYKYLDTILAKNKLTLNIKKDKYKSSIILYG